MKKPPAFQFYSADYLSSAKVQMMSLAAQGAYIRLLCYQWQDGSIPDEVQKLAPLVGSRVNNFKTLWDQIRPCFDVVVAPGRIANARLEAVRNEQIAYREKQAEHGREGAEIKKAALKGTHKGDTSSSSPSSSSPSEKSVNTSSILPSPTPEKSPGRLDAAAEEFRASYLVHRRNPYEWMSGDFPQLAKLRKRLRIGTTETPEEWAPALANYFASPFVRFSLQHFAADFDTFKNSHLDRFKVPVNHVNGGSNGKLQNTKADRNAERTRNLLLARHQQNSSRGDSGTIDGDAGRVLGIPDRTHK